MDSYWNKVKRVAKDLGFLLTTSQYGGKVTSCQLIGLEYHKVIYSMNHGGFVVYNYSRPAYSSDEFKAQLDEGTRVQHFLENV